MNLLNECTKKEIELIKQAGVIIEDKDYDNEELKRCESQIVDFIMSHSSKNKQIDSLHNQYSSIFRTINITIALMLSISYLLLGKYMQTRVGKQPHEYSKQETKYDEILTRA
mgnify:CR=1 FL=1